MTSSYQPPSLRMQFGMQQLLVAVTIVGLVCAAVASYLPRLGKMREDQWYMLGIVSFAAVAGYVASALVWRSNYRFALHQAGALFGEVTVWPAYHYRKLLATYAIVACGVFVAYLMSLDGVALGLLIAPVCTMELARANFLAQTRGRIVFGEQGIVNGASFHRWNCLRMEDFGKMVVVVEDPERVLTVIGDGRRLIEQWQRHSAPRPQVALPPTTVYRGGAGGASSR